ncbi:MAG: SusD/RagB family nutrient-binding outer membrane lipoprotein [Bacteroidetes bacterium]|nr:MAG: SusD/RagB family nutrient-binding outer membrane lipoprotein [Bacteroidota bacterium]
MRKYNIIFILFLVFGFTACTEDFVEINTNPNAITAEEASAAYFLPKAQYKLYSPDRYPYWRGPLIHADRYAGYYTFGFHNSWWNDGLGYTFHGGYTDATWANMFGNYFGFINTYLLLTQPGGDFENELSHAVGLILKGLYYQQYTDVFGMIPYSEAGDPDILLPKFDSQKDIYKGVLADLNTAIDVIGDAEKTGDGVEDISTNDLFFAGDLQQWKAFANSLRLRIALRALDADGDDFASGEINKALAEDLLEAGDGAVMIEDNEISEWNACSYGDIWHAFGAGGNWKLSQTLVNYLRDYDDPRLSIYAKPAQGGTVTVVRPDETEDPEGYTLFPVRIAYILSVLDEANVDYTLEDNDPEYSLTMAENTYYVGQPTRLNGQIKPLARYEIFSDPSDYILGESKTDPNVAPEMVMTTAEVYFLRAEAAVRGFGSEDANEMFQNGIRASMQYWGVDDGAIETYIGASDLAVLNGGDTENLEKIAIQKWIAQYTDGFEGWATVRDSGFPTQLSAGVEDADLFSLGDINGAYPQRMQYGGSAYNTNGANVDAANAAQGDDKQDTKLWWAK